MNRIHWRSTARHGEIQVKEFDLEQTADAWIILDLQRSADDSRRSLTELMEVARPAEVITPPFLREIYGLDARVLPDPETGTLLIIPRS